eukprot:TRINITY_DN3358_c0_g2_i1.p1 TRINITY_DN3358_c0_g2~~TRINITY_DN3358_c0_g2_i1.p1  ORF type:complete len:421 (+),score=43.92 TRINITY_DN3358_c0_g2_i1:99-1361(+)
MSLFDSCGVKACWYTFLYGMPKKVKDEDQQEGAESSVYTLQNRHDSVNSYINEGAKSLALSLKSVFSGYSRNSFETQPSQVVSIGEALHDLIADQKGVERHEVASWTAYPGGAPANVAAALSTLGVPVTFVGALGEDDRGHELYNVLQDKGVNMEGVQRHEKPTRAVYVTRNESGDRELAGFGLPTHHYSDCHIDPNELPIQTIEKSKFLVSGTLGLAYPDTKAALQRAAQIAKGSTNGTQVLIDVNWRPVFFDENQLAHARHMIEDYVQNYADIIKITDDEAEWLLGINRTTALKEPSLIANHFPKVRGVLVTAGEHGASFCFRDTATRQFLQGFIPVFDVKVVDTTGAGDAFTGGFLAYIIQAGGLDAIVKGGESSLKTAVRFAAACGALTVQGAGAIAPQPSYKQVQNFLTNQYYTT